MLHLGRWLFTKSTTEEMRTSSFKFKEIWQGTIITSKLFFYNAFLVLRNASFFSFIVSVALFTAFATSLTIN